MKEYKILTYKPICNFNDNLSYGNIFELLTKQRRIISDDYANVTGEEFGLYSSDALNARFHAENTISMLMSDKSNEHLKTILLQDIRNYIRCIEFGTGNYRTGTILFIAALWADCDKELSKMLIGTIALTSAITRMKIITDTMRNLCGL